MKQQKLALISALAALSSVLVACGGGGGGSGPCVPSQFVELSYQDARVANDPAWSNTSVYFPSLEKVTYNPLIAQTCGASMTFRGSVPAGLTLDSKTGVITGIPTKFGTQTATVGVSISGYSGEATYSFGFRVDDFGFGYGVSTLTHASGSPVNLQATLNDGIITNINIYSTIPSNGQSNATRGSLIPAGATTLYSLASGVLPPGVTLDPSSGLISGTPTTVGTYNFTVGLAVTFQNATIQTPDITGQSLQITVN